MLTYITYLPGLFIFTTIVLLFSSLYVYPNPPCQLPLSEETEALMENPQLTERWQTLFTWYNLELKCQSNCIPNNENFSHESVARTHDLRAERRLLWRMPHWSPCRQIPTKEHLMPLAYGRGKIGGKGSCPILLHFAQLLKINLPC
jgi:hypothetical protein